MRFRSLAAVKELIAQGAGINVVDKKSKSTPLHRAVTSTGAPGTAGKQEEAIQIVDTLLAFGATPNLKNKLGKRPADYARDPEILRRRKHKKAEKYQNGIGRVAPTACG